MSIDYNSTGPSKSTTQEDLQREISILSKFGGFDFLETMIDNLQNLNPERKARRAIFLTERSKSEERKELKKRLDHWIALLKDCDNAAAIANVCIEKSEKAALQLKVHLKTVVEKANALEKSYRTTDLFFKNTETNKINNLSVVNASVEQLQNLKETLFIDSIRDEIVSGFDRLDLRTSYSLLILPGFLGSKKVIDTWSQIAHDNKVMLVTDFEHLDSPDYVIEDFEKSNFTGGDPYLSNIVMTCNWLQGRPRYVELGEEDNLFIPPSAALGGRMYGALLSQVTAGKKFGGLAAVEDVAFDLKKSEIAMLEKIGLIPMVKEYGKVMAFSAKTLFDGDNLGLQTYSMVRLFDYISKCLMDFLNRRAFEIFNVKTEENVRSQVVKFLESITGPSKSLDSFTLLRFERDADNKENIFLDIRLQPFFPSKPFVLKMLGNRGDDGNGWNTEYSQR